MREKRYFHQERNFLSVIFIKYLVNIEKVSLATVHKRAGNKVGCWLYSNTDADQWNIILILTIIFKIAIYAQTIECSEPWSSQNNSAPSKIFLPCNMFIIAIRELVIKHCMHIMFHGVMHFSKGCRRNV